MSRLARFLDARSTAEGKLLSVLLAALLALSMLNVAVFTERAAADPAEEVAETEQVEAEASAGDEAPEAPDESSEIADGGGAF